MQDVNSVVKQNSIKETCDWTTDVHVPEEHKKTITNFLKTNQDLFAGRDSDLGHTDTVKMKIGTQNHPPIKLRPYRTPIKDREVVDKAVDEMLEANVIRRSKSPWSFPVVIMDKKDGSKRFCVDFRKLNQITKPNSYPLPLIDDILALLGRARYFTSLDLKSGYWQVLMDEADKEKTAFACHRGLFEFNVMPFGLWLLQPYFSSWWLLFYRDSVISPQHIWMTFWFTVKLWRSICSICKLFLTDWENMDWSWSLRSVHFYKLRPIILGSSSMAMASVQILRRSRLLNHYLHQLVW